MAARHVLLCGRLCAFALLVVGAPPTSRPPLPFPCDFRLTCHVSIPLQTTGTFAAEFVFDRAHTVLYNFEPLAPGLAPLFASIGNASAPIPLLPMLLMLYRRFTLWDYSRANVRLLQRSAPIVQAGGGPASAGADGSSPSPPWVWEQLHSDSHHVPLGSVLAAQLAAFGDTETRKETRAGDRASAAGDDAEAGVSVEEDIDVLFYGTVNARRAALIYEVRLWHALHR